jgi:hypothetical protein
VKKMKRKMKILMWRKNLKMRMKWMNVDDDDDDDFGYISMILN